MRVMSPITQNVLLLRHVEANARLFRMLTVLKVRDSEHDNRLREFRITSRGIELADTFEDTSEAMTGTVHQAPEPAARRNGSKRSSPRKRPPPSRPRPRARKR